MTLPPPSYSLRDTRVGPFRHVYSTHGCAVARILIVDDELTDQRLLYAILEGSGHSVYGASNGEQAFKIYLRKGIDVVVTDLAMPHVDGLELITSLRALFPEAAIIAVSGRGPDLLAKAAVEGAFVTLTKPVDPRAFLEAVAKAVPDG